MKFKYLFNRWRKRKHDASALIKSIEAEQDAAEVYLISMYAAFRYETKIPIEHVALVVTNIRQGTVYQYRDAREIEGLP